MLLSMHNEIASLVEKKLGYNIMFGLRLGCRLRYQENNVLEFTYKKLLRKLFYNERCLCCVHSELKMILRATPVTTALMSCLVGGEITCGRPGNGRVDR